MTPLQAFAFTPHDTPGVRRRIEQDLETIVDAVRARDRGAWAVVLTGGFSRGEGTVVREAPLNDYDLVVFRRALPAFARSTYAALRRDLEADVGLHVDLLPVWRGRIPALRPKVFWFDLKHGGRVLHGPPDVLDRIPVGGPAEIPPDEAARLLCNRAVGLLEALPGPDAREDPVYVQMQSAKALLACGEALLILEGEYHPSYQERHRVLRKLLPGIEGEFAQASDLVPLHAWATGWKLDPGEHDGRDPERVWEAARRALLLTAEHALPRAGWGPLDAYPRGAPASLVDAAYYAARTRLAPPALLARPSHEARALALRLLREASFPEGPRVDERELRGAFRRVGAPAPRTWREALERLLAFRALTLQ